MHDRKESVDSVLVRKPEGKEPHGRLEHRWKDNIKMYLKEIGCGMNSCDLGYLG
jgi:hypothetical protein